MSTLEKRTNAVPRAAAVSKIDTDVDDDVESKMELTARQSLSRRQVAPSTNLSHLVLFMAVLGFIAAMFIFIVHAFVAALFEARRYVSVDLTSGILGHFVYVLTGVALCLTSTLVCQQWSREAEGSGLPQMKAVMSGFHDKLRGALQWQALAAKAVGLICAISGGLPLGWEGPNVHMSCIIADLISKIPYFRDLRNDPVLKMQIMSCACTVGLASSFGTPIGAVLYALESTGSFYLVPTFWKSVLATIAGAMVFELLYKTPFAEAFANTTFGMDDYDSGQLFVICGLGAIMGCLGAFFVKCSYEAYLFRQKNLTWWFSNRFVLVGSVALVSALLQYNNDLLRLDTRSAVNELFSSDAMQLMTYTDVIFLLLIKFPLTAVSIGLPVPGGVFIQAFLLGAGMGRLFGELISSIPGVSVVPGLYAVVGAASFTAGVTRALSCSVMIFEVTGQISHMMPVLVAVLVSVIVANSFNTSLYDTLIVMRNLPYMPHLRKELLLSQRVTEIMDTEVFAVKEKTSSQELEVLMNQCPKFSTFPVIGEDGSLLGSVRTVHLELLLDRQRVGGDTVTSSVAAPNGSTEHTPSAEITRSSENLQITVTADSSPLEVGDSTTVSQLHYMFVMLMPSHAYVVSRGKLAGVVKRRHLIQM